MVAAIGPLQAQSWAAPPVGIWARTGRRPDLAGPLAARELVYGFLLRGTLHLAAGAQHPSYAAVVEAAGSTPWFRSQAAPPPEMDDLRHQLLEFAARPQAAPQLIEFIEGWLETRRPPLDPAELALQRRHGWRPLLRWAALARAPEDGRWGSRPPLAQVAAPTPPDRWPKPEAALEDVIRWHLRAFGPAAADDVAAWIGWKSPPVRAAMDRLGLERLEDERGRPLYDVPGAPRPDPETEAPPRLLPAFDNVILAYAPGNRARILPDQYRDRLYQRANLQWLPAILVDGMVAGTWSRKSGLQPYTTLPRRVMAELAARLAQSPA